MKIIGGPYESINDSQNEKTVRRVRLLILILELLWLPAWWLSAVLSIPSSGEEWQYWLVFSPLWAYPGLIVIAFVISEAFLRKNMIEKVRAVMLLPPIISYGYPLGMSIIASLVKEVIGIFA
jgi:hypothetical protein